MVARLLKNAMLTCDSHGLVSNDANKSISKIGQLLVKIRGHGRPRKFLQQIHLSSQNLY